VLVQENFESLFRHYEASAQFQYLKSFRRARIIFEDLQSAAAAHQGLYNYEFHGQQIKCYYAQVDFCAHMYTATTGWHIKYKYVTLQLFRVILHRYSEE